MTLASLHIFFLIATSHNWIKVLNTYVHYELFLDSVGVVFFLCPLLKMIFSSFNYILFAYSKTFFKFMYLSQI